LIDIKALITGITGFVGSHLAEFLLARGVKVYGTVRWRSRLDNITHLDGKIHLVECDMKDPVSMRRVLNEVQPDHVYHLAAQSFVPTSWKAPAATLDTNIMGQLNLFEGCRDIGINPLIQIAGSSEEYGMVYPDEVPIKEDNPLRPLSPYAVSKVAQDMLAYQYHQSYGLNVIRTRAFNHTGPRRGDVFVTSNFAKQIASIEKGLQEPVVKVGNLEAKRDFTDVRDVVNGYWLGLTKGKPGEVYNLASGRTVTINEVLDILLSNAQVKIRVEQDPERLRPSDVPILWGDYSKIHQQTGWQPQIPLEQTLSDLLNYWREKLAKVERWQ
jgi:GDP-4-dehydro-6-deoxy-D-mannose reductase